MTSRTVTTTTQPRKFSPFPLAKEWDALWSRYLTARRAGDIEAEQAVVQEIRAWHAQYGLKVPPAWAEPGSIDEAVKGVVR